MHSKTHYINGNLHTSGAARTQGGSGEQDEPEDLTRDQGGSASSAAAGARFKRKLSSGGGQQGMGGVGNFFQKSSVLVLVNCLINVL
jgi:hypothetical protein